MGNLRAKNDYQGPGLLARAWWELVNNECPADWTELLAEIDFDNPDQQLEPQSLPVLEYLPRMAAAKPAYRVIVDAMIRAQAQLRFGQSYSNSDFGTEFLRQYGWIKMLGPEAYWHSDRLASGFLLLGDKVTYPQHWHQAEEIYLPICGDAEWYREDLGWQKQPAGSLIHHASNIRHGTRTTGEPMIALYVWRSGDLNQKASFQ